MPLVFQYGQPRIFFAMAREGLLPAWASRVRSRYRTPHVTTSLVAAAACLYVMLGLPRHAWERFGISLAIGLIIYFAYGFSHRRPHRDRQAARSA